MTALWSLFTLYLLQYLASVTRRTSTLTDEAKMLWKIHKKNCHCSGNNWKPMTRRCDKIEGFRCECGYKSSQNQPLMAGVP